MKKLLLSLTLLLTVLVSYGQDTTELKTIKTHAIYDVESFAHVRVSPNGDTLSKWKTLRFVFDLENDKFIDKDSIEYQILDVYVDSVREMIVFPLLSVKRLQRHIVYFEYNKLTLREYKIENGLPYLYLYFVTTFLRRDDE